MKGLHIDRNEKKNSKAYFVVSKNAQHFFIFAILYILALSVRKNAVLSYFFFLVVLK
jgi:hypothetical protein